MNNIDNTFTRSLDGLTPDDIAPPPPRKKKKPDKRGITMTVLLAFAVVVFVLCAVYIADYIYDHIKAERLYNQSEPQALDSLINNSNNEPPVWVREQSDSTNGTTTDYADTGNPPDISDNQPGNAPVDEQIISDRLNAIRAELVALNQINPDIIGYLSIPSLGISYPLLQRCLDINNTFYLRHAYDGSELRSGSIFADFRNSPKPVENRNLVIYGHNMRSGSMFGELFRLMKDEALFNKTEIIIATYDGIYTYKLFSAYCTTTDNDYIKTDFTNDNDFIEFCKHEQSCSEVTGNFEFNPTDCILTLSTCTNLTKNGRYAFHAVLMKIEN